MGRTIIYKGDFTDPRDYAYLIAGFGAITYEEVEEDIIPREDYHFLPEYIVVEYQNVKVKR